VTYEAYVVSGTSTRPQVDSAVLDLFAGVFQIGLALVVYALYVQRRVSKDSSDYLLGLALDLLGFVPGLIPASQGCPPSVNSRLGSIRT
jgi:uncharacterized membrane protein YqaE (UPF0057 family)